MQADYTKAMGNAWPSMAARKKCLLDVVQEQLAGKIRLELPDIACNTQIRASHSSQEPDA